MTLSADRLDALLEALAKRRHAVPEFVPHGTRCEADDARGDEFGPCDHGACARVTDKDSRERWVCRSHELYWLRAERDALVTELIALRKERSTTMNLDLDELAEREVEPWGGIPISEAERDALVAAARGGTCGTCQHLGAYDRQNMVLLSMGRVLCYHPSYVDVNHGSYQMVPTKNPDGTPFGCSLHEPVVPR